MVVITINIILTLVELAVDQESVQLSLQIINYFFVAFYIGETVMKVRRDTLPHALPPYTQ